MTADSASLARSGQRQSGERRAVLLGYALVAAAAVLWGLLGPVARLAFEHGVRPLELSFWRAIIAGGLCLAVAFIRGRWRIRAADALGIVGFGLVGVATFYAAYFLAVQHAGAALTAVLLYTAPAWVALASVLWLRETLTWQTVSAVAITLVGVALVTLGGDGVASFGIVGIAWGLVAGLAYASYYIVGRHYFARYDTLTVLGCAMTVGALALLPWAAPRVPTAAAWTPILFVAIFPTFIAYLIYGAGLLRVNPTRAATVAAVEPVVAAGAAYAFWGERFTIAGYVGAALVIAAVVWMASGPDPTRYPDTSSTARPAG